MSIKQYIYLILSTIVTFYSINSYAQNLKEIETNADLLVKEKSYSKANEIYINLLEKDSINYKVIYKYANSLRLQLDYHKANYQYNRLIQSNNIVKTETYFYYAQTSKSIENYQDAIKYYRKYIELGKNSSSRRISEQEMESCLFSISHKSDSINTLITHLPPPINTPYSEFNSVQLSDNAMIFSRYYPQFSDSIENVFSQNYLADIFVAKQSISGWKKPSLFSKRLSSNKYFTANISFTKNKREAYFTRCIDNGGKIGKCHIYHTKLKNGKWSRPKKVSKVNVDNYTSTHPNIVQLEDYSILYFSSDRPNGFGNSDIWYSIIRNNNIEDAQNMGSIINTKGDEITPFYDKNSHLLFFSSNTHKGFGGYDIFKISGALSSWKDLQNMGPKLNSSANDMYYAKGIDDNTAFFSSNRKGSYYHDGLESCCTDIYMAENIIPILEKPTENDSIPTEVSTTDSIVLEIKKLLPLSLFFENDMPDKKSTKTYTTANYKDLLKEYIKAKDIYKEEYSKGLNKENSKIARAQIDDFFTSKVEYGFEDLNKFTELLKKELSKKKHIRIKIRGYASPLNSPEYNLALSKRRISSLKNFIMDYDNGYFRPYIENPNDSLSKLSIYEDPLGDSQSLGLVSDNPNDKRNSIYSREAALQRKIQIIMYSSGKDFSMETDLYPILYWKRKIIYAGKIKQGENKSLIANFTNIGAAELKIDNFSSTDNYIQIKTSGSFIQANNKSKIYILIDTRDLPLGKHSTTISHKSNEIGNNEDLIIKFEVE